MDYDWLFKTEINNKMDHESWQRATYTIPSAQPTMVSLNSADNRSGKMRMKNERLMVTTRRMNSRMRKPATRQKNCEEMS